MPRWNEDTGKLRNGFMAQRKRLQREKIARERTILRTFLPADHPEYLAPTCPHDEDETHNCVRDGCND